MSTDSVEVQAADRTPAPPAEVERVLSVSSISKSYGVTRALDDVTFEIGRGQVHALLGGNGSGKSTLIKVLAGVVKAAAGGTVVIGSGDDARRFDTTDLTARVAREVGLRFVHQDLAIFPDLSIAENLALGSGFATDGMGRVRWREQRRRAAEVLKRFEVNANPGQPCVRLRPAQQTLLAIARALQDTPHAVSDGSLSENRILILDEPTATLPQHEVDVLLSAIRRLAGRGYSVLLVDHRLEEIRGIADAFTVLRDGRHVCTAPMRDHTAADLAELIVGGAMGTSNPIRTRGQTNDEPLRVDALHAGGVRSVSLAVDAGEIVGLAGLTGSGCTTLLRAIAGDRKIEGGTVQLGGAQLPTSTVSAARRAGVVLVPEQRSQIVFPEMSVASNVTGRRVARYWHGYLSRRAERLATDEVLRRFGVVTASGAAAMSSLSGGNQQKVILAAALDQRPKILLLDEPTQGVDVGARRAIHDVIRNAAAEGACVLVASSDLDELVELCGRVLILRRGTIGAELSGGELTEHAVLASVQASGSSATPTTSSSRIE